MHCSKRGTKNPSVKTFRGEGGALLASLCPKCGALNPAGRSFCGQCGASLETPAAAVSISKSADPQIRLADPQSAENLKGERKTITDLFAYIAGSTEERDPDPEEARASIDPALKLMIDAARRYHGYVLQSTGEGIFALFGANSSDASALWSRYACGRFQRLEREIAYAPSVSDASQGG